MNTSKKLIIYHAFITLLIFWSGAWRLGAAEWQKKYNYQELRQNFAQPPLWYAPHTFWFWDAPLEPAQVASMARQMTQQGLNPGYAHARHAGDPTQTYPKLPVHQWLGPLWFQSFDLALKEAETAGMTLGYCDDYWWPSGQAAGRVLEQQPRLKAQSLEWNRREVTGPGTITVSAAKFTVAGRLSENNRIIASTLFVLAEGKPVTWNVPSGRWVIYSYDLYHHAGVDGGEVNYLDPELMDVFIPIAHEPYQDHFGDRMGKSIPGVFVDNEGDYGWKMAWSDYLPRRYQELKNRDLRIWLPLLTEQDEDGLWAKARYDWFDVVSEVYTHQFLGRLNDWLEQRGMYYISNLWEETLMLQTRAVGDFMRAQRAVSMPGTDCLELKSQQVHDFKETQSVCEFADRPFMSELMGVAGWEQTPVQMKMTANAVTAWGVTHSVPHGINLNRQLATIPYPADWFTENPYWRYFHLWTDFTRRASFVNRQGQLVAEVLLINPLASVWALSEGYFTSIDGNQWPDRAIEINDTYAATMEVLTRAWLDYLVADTHYLQDAVVIKSDEHQPAKIKIGRHSFSVIVLPPMVILSRATAANILAFGKAGGVIVVLGALPEGSPEIGARDPVIQEQMRQLRRLASVIDLSRQQDKLELLPKRIATAIAPQIRMITGDLPLLSCHRKIDDNHFYWFANNTHRRQQCTLSLRDGSGRAEVWDCETGQVQPVYYEKTNNRNLIELEFQPYLAFWLVFDAAQSPIPLTQEKLATPEEIIVLESWQMSLPETNRVYVSSARSMVTADSTIPNDFNYPDSGDSGRTWQNMIGPVRIDDTWKAGLLFIPEPNSTRYFRTTFSLSDNPESGLLTINADNAVRFWLNGQPVEPGPHANSWANADLHNIGPLLRKGVNNIAVEVTNHPGYGWLILQGMILLQNGATFEIVTDENWNESTNQVEGWHAVDFDDSSWRAVQPAPTELEREIKSRLKKPQQAVFTKKLVWWQTGIPPGASAVKLPGLSGNARVWIDGNPVSIMDEQVRVPGDARMLTIKIPAGTNGLAQPAEFICTGAGPGRLGSWLDLGLRRFTGFVDYETHFELPESGQRITIDLGKVLHMAEVWLNDSRVDARLWPPFTFDASDFVRPGRNRLKVRVGNLMVNEMGLQDDLGQLRHWGWRGTPPDSCFDAGLFGPVRVLVEY